jgi:hypothetical protein
VTVLYEGHQIYFGPTGEAQKFFTDMGFFCPPRQTTADFLTSLTSPSERRVRPGYEDKVPRTPVEFAQRWRNSPECARLLREIDAFDQVRGSPSLDAVEATVSLLTLFKWS